MKSNHKKVNVVVPVYGDWKSLAQNIESLKKYYSSKDDVAVYYVNDCGPQADLIEKNIKSAISGLSNFHYARNKKNLGFVKNCNNAVFKIVKDKAADVLLLNSDTITTKGFLEEMLRILYSQNDICAVNPRSNNATVWSVPMNSSLVGRPRKSYRLWQRLKEQIPDKYISPTAHGFCMLVRRSVIDKIGLFDEIYGRGYGEENDFTMRARKAGWKCAVANHAFVFHHGSRSFGVKKRVDLSSKNSEILLERYPEYNRLVAQYVREHQEPSVIRSRGVTYRAFKIATDAVEYGYTNGYVNMAKKAISVVRNRLLPKSLSASKPTIQVWSHELTKTGAPLVLLDIIRQWRKDNDFPENIVFNVPSGAHVDGELSYELSNEGVHFNRVHSSEARFNNGDVVIMNSTALPPWLYDKVIAHLQNNTIKHLYFYIHEDDEKTTYGTEKHREPLARLLREDKVTVYAPSSGSTRNWKKYFDTDKNILPMPGRISFGSKMFVPKTDKDFDKINFVLAGSREPRKGILNVMHALQTIDKYHLQKSPGKYRDFTLTIAGNDYGGDFYNRFVQNEAKYFGNRIKLLGNTHHDDIYKILAKSNITITYSLTDSLSMVTFEGMAFGHPIIRSEVSGLEEQLIVGKNGWLARTSNWGELVDTIEEVLNKDKTSNKRLASMSRESIKIAESNYRSRYRILDDIKKSLA